MLKIEDTGFTDHNGKMLSCGDYVSSREEFKGEVGVVRRYGEEFGIDWNMFGNDYKPDWDDTEFIGSEEQDGDSEYPVSKL